VVAVGAAVVGTVGAVVVAGAAVVTGGAVIVAEVDVGDVVTLASFGSEPHAATSRARAVVDEIMIRDVLRMPLTLVTR